ncbi:MAG: type IV toxin-antitoxin system AbiEi family antitoxin [Thiohalomonadales bacterium]
MEPQDIQQNLLLKEALAAYEGVTATAAIVIHTQLNLDGEKADAEIKIGDMQPLIAEVKATIRPATLLNVIAQLNRFHRPVILVTRYVTPQLAETLKENDILFIDTAGNAYLQGTNTFVYITGRKLKTKPQEKTIRAFRAKGLKVIFALLCRPEFVNAPYREIADKAGVALGTVTNVVKDLEQLGYLYRSKKKGLVLENKNKLIKLWAEAYPLELRPQLKPQRFKVMQTDWWKELDHKQWQKLNIWLGGEAAAAVITRYLYPEFVTVYGRPEFTKFAQIIQPAKDELGNFELLEPFWNFEVEEIGKIDKAKIDTEQRLCPPLLIYADLMATGDARQLDAAEIIWEKYLATD